MTIPADINSVSGLIQLMIECFRGLPHIRDLEEPLEAVSGVRDWLLEQRDEPLTVEDESGLESFQDVLRDDLRYFFSNVMCFL